MKLKSYDLDHIKTNFMYFSFHVATVVIIMKVWIVCVLLCAAFTLKTTAGEQRKT